MGQKVNPHGMRVGVIKDWDSRWYARDEKVGDLLVEDKKIRDYLKKTLYGAGIPKIEIERQSDVVTIFMHCARPGQVIGKDGYLLRQPVQIFAEIINTVFFLSISPDNVFCKCFAGGGAAGTAVQSGQLFTQALHLI